MISLDFFNQDYISKNQQIQLPILDEKGVELCIKREDEIHPDVSGNKFRKLKYNIQEAQKTNKQTLLTFGGAFSNHILATAVAGNIVGLKTIGVIRGDELGIDLMKTLQNNATLRKASENGMHFEFVSRGDYRQKSESDFTSELEKKFGNFYLVPEGGTNDLAIKGCQEILTNEDRKFNYICCAVGTGGTISGLINSTEKHQKVLGFPALKGDFLKAEIQSFANQNHWDLVTNYHFGGYAKYTDDLIRFVNDFKKRSDIQLDPIYTGKMLFGILDMVAKNQFKKGDRILAIHTGGIQGISGFNQQLLIKNKNIIEI